MYLRAPAIVLAARQHGETAVIARLLTEHEGVIAGYVAGGRGRALRPVVMAGNLVDLDLRSRSESQLPFARLELTVSRGPWLSEPLPAAAIGWVCALTATVLPERQAFPQLYNALSGVLDAVCLAPSARGWAAALAGYEALMLRELGYGEGEARPPGDLAQVLAAMDRLGPALRRNLLADRHGDVMAARDRLRAMLGKIAEGPP